MGTHNQNMNTHDQERMDSMNTHDQDGMDSMNTQYTDAGVSVADQQVAEPRPFDQQVDADRPAYGYRTDGDSPVHRHRTDGDSPTGGQRLDPGTLVYDADGRWVGIVSPRNTPGPHLVVQRGRLLPRDVSVPASAIARADEDGVTLHLSKRALKRLRAGRAPAGAMGLEA